MLQCTHRQLKAVKAVSPARSPLTAGPRLLARPLVPCFRYRHPPNATPADGADPSSTSSKPAAAGAAEQQQQQRQGQQGQEAAQIAAGDAATAAAAAEDGSNDGAPHDAASAAAFAAAGEAASQQQQQQQAPSVPAFSLAAALDPVAQLLLGLWALLQVWLRRWLVRAGLGAGLALLALHLLLNRLVLPLANQKLLPGLLAEAEALTMRQVCLGGVSRVWLPGLFGLGPLVTLQQLEVGPGPAEKSSAQVPEVHVRVLPAASLAQRQLQLQLAVVRPYVRVVQGSNFSWLGYPQDTTPSSRDLLPGLTLRRQQQQEAEAAAAAAASAGGSSRGGSIGSWRDGGMWHASEDSGAGDEYDDDDDDEPPAASSRGGSASSSVSSSSASSSVSSSSSASRGSAWPAAAGAAGGPHSRRPPFASVSAPARGPQDWGSKQQQQQRHSGAAAEPCGSAAEQQGRDADSADAQQQLLHDRRASHASASSSGRDGQQQPGARRSRHQAPWQGNSSQPGQRWWQQQRRQQEVTSYSDEAEDTSSGDASSSSTSDAVAAVPSAQQQQQQQQVQVGLPMPPAVLQSPGSGEAGGVSLSQETGSSNGNSSATATGSDELQDDDEAEDGQTGAWAEQHSSGVSSSSGSSGSGSDSERSVGSSGAASSSSSGGGGSCSEFSDEGVTQQQTSEGELVPFTGPVSSSTAAAPLEQRQQAVAAANVLSAARSWLLARCQALAAAALRAGVGAASSVASSAAGAVRVRLSGLLPAPALHSITISSGRLDYVVWGEVLPRTVDNVAMRMSLGPRYSWMEILVDGDALPRHPASTKCTLVNPNAKRHLRHVTPGAAGTHRLRRFACDVLPPAAAAAIPQQGSAAAISGEAGEAAGSLQGTAAGAAVEPSGPEAAADSGPAAVSAGELSQQQQQQLSSQGEEDEELEPVLELEGGGSTAAAPYTGGSSSSSSRLKPGDAVGSSSSSISISSSTSRDVATAEPQQPVPADAVGQAAQDQVAAVLPLATLHIPAGQQGLPSRVHFLLPEELQAWQQQQGASSTDAVQQTGSGRLSVRVLHRWTKALTGRDNFLLSASGGGLAAPLVERLLELPMDIHSGTLEGELHVAAYDDTTWSFPAITGKLACRDVDLHFWDAPDDIQGASMDLLFERDRVYLHKATGSFGAIPLSVSGDLDLSPQAGQYRLQASVGPVEVNSLRATLAVRPIPFPVAGALRGVLHITGPLEKPIFSGSTSAVRPPPALLVGVEDTPALRALLADPAAVVAYDHVPASAANGVFTLDTSTEMFVLHSGQAVPAGGGLLQAAGRMWVAAAAESDPRAISMEAGGSGLNAGALAERYVNDPQQPASGGPAAILAGAGPLNVRGSMSGSHLAPATRVDWASPSSGLSGSASFTPTALSMASSGPGFKLRASAVTSNPTAAQARAANTQSEATFFGTPRVEAFQLEGSLAGVDLLPLAAAAAPQPQARTGSGSTGSSSSGLPAGMGSEAPPALVDGSPVRLRVSGAVALSAVREGSPAARRQAGMTGDDGYLFTGPVVLDGLRLNQLSLCRHLSGDLNLTAPRLLLRGKGSGRAGDELLELDLALPPPPAPPVDPPGPDGIVLARLYYPPGFAPAARLSGPPLLPGQGSGSAAVTGEQRGGAAAAQRQEAQGGGSGAAGDGDGGAEDAAEAGWDEWAVQQQQRLPGTADGSAAVSAAAAADAQRASHVLLRRGDLHFSSTVNASGSEFAAALEHLPLDELELGSLRGLLVSAVLDVDLAAAAGRLSASLASPRFSGLAGTSLSAQARWERDIVLLERAVLTQPNSRYELAAEYVMPPGFALPRSIAEAQAAASAAAAAEQQPSSSSSSQHPHHHHHHGAAGAGSRKHAALKEQQQSDQQQQAMAAAASATDIEGGRWRLQLVVPHAAVEELLPAGQLLRRASRVSGLDYPRAKARFLAGLAGAAISAGGEFSSQVAALAEAAASAAAAAAAASGQAPATMSSGSSSAVPSLPGLQELRGTWSGCITAVGGGPGAAAAAPQLEYDLAGSGWRAGPYTLDQLLLRGSADACEGLNLDELRLVVGQAQLTLRGALLGRQQDASFALSDFPAVLLQPLFSALPALQHATPALDVRAAAAGGRPPGSSASVGSSSVLGGGASSALSGLSSRLESSLSALGLKLPAGREEQEDPLAPFLSSPVSGLLNVRGSLGGSAAAPTGVLHLKLLDGALGSQRLAKAAASLALNAAQQLSLDVQLAPADSHGHIKLAGSIDLAGDSSKQQQQPASKSGSISSSSRGIEGKGSSKAGKTSRAKGSKERQLPPPPPPQQQQQQQQQQAQPSSNGGGGSGSSSAAAASAEPHLALALAVKDGGMCLLTGLAPGITWGGGSAAVNLAASGPAAAPLLTGSASFSKGSLATSFLRHPVSQLTGSLSLDGQRLAVAGLEARVGPKGALAVRGSLSLKHGSSSTSTSSSSSQAAEQDQLQGAEGLAIGLAGVELRLRNMYSGSLDASLRVAGSLAAPQLGGQVVFSRGTAYLVPPAASGPAAAGGTAGGPAAAAAAAAAGGAGSSQLGQAELVRTAFAALKAGKARTALDQHSSQQASSLPMAMPGQQLAPAASPMQQQQQPGTHTAAAQATPGQQGQPPLPQQQPPPQLLLCGLELVLGPELRAVFPVVLNVGVSGRVTLHGNPAAAGGLRPSGSIRLEGGVLNLVATQFRLEREHPNTISFSPESGLDPVVDVALSSSELRAVISGKASAWQEQLTLTAVGPAAAAAASVGGGPGGVGVAGGTGAGGSGAGGAGGREGGLAGLGDGDLLGSRAVARVFEGRLAEALLAEDGSLSLATLAGNTLGSLLPKIETQGQLGKARWRLVSAPSLPGLLSSADPQASPGTAAGGAGAASPSDAGPRLLRSLALGTEVELALGRSLVAAVSHNMPAAASDGGEPGTEVRLSLAVSRQLRLLVQQRGLRLAPSVLLQFNSEGTPWVSTSQ